MVQNQNKNMNRIFGNVLENLKANFRIITITKASKTNYTQSTNSVDEAQHESLCRNELSLQFSLGYRCPNPSSLTDEQWKYIYALPTKSQRKKHFKFLYHYFDNKTRNESIEAIRKEIIEHKREKIQQKHDHCEHIIYGLGYNSLFNRLNRKAITKLSNIRLLRYKLYGQKLLVDCTFDDQMTQREVGQVASKLEKIFIDNRDHMQPFDLHYFGDPKTSTGSLGKFCKQMPTIFQSVTGIHNKCYTDIFPRDRLVMLTSDSNCVLDYDPKDIYVIGGIVDSGRNEQLMLSKAKQLDLRTARLPLNCISLMKGQSAELTVDCVARILRACRSSNDWKKILEQNMESDDHKSNRLDIMRLKLRINR